MEPTTPPITPAPINTPFTTPASTSTTSITKSGTTATEALELAAERIDRGDDPAVVIARPALDRLRELAAEIDAADPAAVPLRGTTFSVKDNIDVADVVTSVGCPPIGYRAERSATVVERLVAAGALPVAKVNLDQFATGLNGTRSPFGTPRNPFDPALVPGGSSSGSGVSVAAGLVDFSVGTDTAGSGRVPAALCGIASVKPTPGRVSNAGIVPAVRSVDCPALFARELSLAGFVTDLAAGFDGADPYSRRSPADVPPPLMRLGVLDADRLVSIGVDGRIAAGYARILDLMLERGFELSPIDPTPLFDIGDELYGGPWVVERAMAVRALAPDVADIDPTVAEVLSVAGSFSAADVHAAFHRLHARRHRVDELLDGVDGFALPTVGWWPTLDELAAEPVEANARLGRFTTFTNLVGMCVATVPLPELRDPAVTGSVPPPSLSIHAPGWADAAAVAAGRRLLGEEPEPPVGWVVLAVAGAHLRGQALDHQLVDRGASFVATTASAPSYRLYAMDTEPPKPAMVHVGAGGSEIEVDLWALSPAAFGDFVASIPPPLGIGTVELADGRQVPGFIAEPRATDGATDVTSFGGWRAYRASLA